MQIKDVIIQNIFSMEDINNRPSWVSEKGELNKCQAILNQILLQNIDLSSLIIRKTNGDDWFCIYSNQKFCYCRCSYNDDNQNYNDISKIQIEFGFEKDNSIVFDKKYKIMDILMPLNACT